MFFCFAAAHSLMPCSLAAWRELLGSSDLMIGFSDTNKAEPAVSKGKSAVNPNTYLHAQRPPPGIHTHVPQT